MTLIAGYMITIIELVKKVQRMFCQYPYENMANAEWSAALKSKDFRPLTDPLLRAI